MKDYKIIPLALLLDRMGKVKTEEFLSRFQCERDADVQSFLLEKAILFEKKHLSRTYLLVKEICEEEPLELVGYFAVAIRGLEIPSDSTVSNSMRRRMNIVGEGNLAQSYLIGQLGKMDGMKDKIGARLINDSIDIIKKANEKVGCRVIHLDCRPDLVPFYQDHGFRLVVEENGHDLNTMVLFL